MDQLGRALPVAIQRDTGGTENDTYDIRKRAAEDRKRQRAEKKARLKSSPDSLSSVSESGSSTTAYFSSVSCMNGDIKARSSSNPPLVILNIFINVESLI
mmetsp:Transcript_12591/g.17204  ORF Transcript_12591/g.17204 Transcript_12591/m.17204 type:complete len:100 (-) Transcript_12591:222-521(-)